MIQSGIRIQSGLIVLVSILEIALVARERNFRPAVPPDPVKQSLKRRLPNRLIGSITRTRS